MAMKPCRECKREISSHAKTCPHCGVKDPFKAPFIRGLDNLGSGMIKLGLLLVVLYILFAMLACAPVGADDHQRVAWDALQPGKAHMIRTQVHSHAHYLPVRAGVVRFPGGGFFKVHERVTHESTLWYLTTWVKPRSLDPNDNVKGWVRAAELHEHGAYVVRGYD